MWGAVSHFLSFTLGTIAGVTLMCLLQAGRQADEQFTKFFDKEGGVSGRRWLAGVLVRGPSGGAGPAGGLWGTVRQMAVCGSSYPSCPLEI